MKKTKGELGDVFCVELDERGRKYFQLVAIDQTQLNSDVILAFKRSYSSTECPSPNDVVRDEWDFHAHVFVRLGLKLGYWSKVGNADIVGETSVLFRDSVDYGNPEVGVSDDWWVWRINEPQRRIGKLDRGERDSEIGVVVAPDSLVHRMRTGVYDFVYPSY